MNLNKNRNSPAINYTFVHRSKRFQAGETQQSSTSSSASDEIRTDGLDKSDDAPQSTSSEDPPSHNGINPTRSCPKEINSEEYLHNHNTNVGNIITPIERIQESQTYNQSILSRRYTQTLICSNNNSQTEKSNSAKIDKEISTDSSGAYVSTICPEKLNEVIKKTIERNIKLQILVDNIILARERDNYKIAWRQCVNEFQNKQNSPLEPSPNSHTFYPIGSLEQNIFKGNDYAKLTNNNNQRHVPAYPEVSQLTFSMSTKNICEAHNACTNLSQSANCNEIDYRTKHELYKDIFGNNTVKEFNSDGSFLNNNPKENQIENMFKGKMTENRIPLVYNEYNPCMNDKKKKKKCNCTEGGGFQKSVSCQCSNTTNNTTAMPSDVANINNSRQLDSIETKLDKLLTTVDDLIKNMQNSAATVGRQLDERSMKRPLYISQDRNIGTTETRIGSGCCRKKMCRSNINRDFDNNGTPSNLQKDQYYESYSRSYDDNGNNSYSDSTHKSFERTSSPINIQQYKNTESCCSKPSCMSNQGTLENKGETLISSSEKRMDNHFYNQQDINTKEMIKSGCCNKKDCRNSRRPGASGQDEFTEPGNEDTEATKMNTKSGCCNKKECRNSRRPGASGQDEFTEPANEDSEATKINTKSGCSNKKECRNSRRPRASGQDEFIEPGNEDTESTKMNTKSGCCNKKECRNSRRPGASGQEEFTEPGNEDTEATKMNTKSGCCNKKECRNSSRPEASEQDEFTELGNKDTKATKINTKSGHCSKKQLPYDRNKSQNVSNRVVSRHPNEYTKPSNTKEKPGCCTRKKFGNNENPQAKSNSVPEEDTITETPDANNKSGCCNRANCGTKNNASPVASKSNSTNSIDKDKNTKKSEEKKNPSCCRNKDCNRNNNSVTDKQNNAKNFTNQECCTHEDFGELKCNCEKCSSKKCKAKPLFWQKSRDKACKLFCGVNKKRNALVCTTGLGEKKDCDEVCLLEVSSYEYNRNRRPKEVPLVIKDSSDSERCASPSAGRYGNDKYVWTLTKLTPGPFTYCSDNSEEEIKIHNLFNKQLSCESYESHVDICIDIPTRDISTVVTESLSKTKLCEKFSCEKKLCIRPSTKAINTEPLTLPSIIRMSSDTIKQLLPTMKFDQFSLFELLHKIHPPNVSAPYTHRPLKFVCSLCGSGFETSTELCAHINSHNLCWKKICKICKVNNSQGLSIVKVFPCRYCGREFERAYCCGWHENLCARSRGQAHDVNESLTFLK